MLAGVTRAIVLTGALALVGCARLSAAFHALTDPPPPPPPEPPQTIAAKPSPAHAPRLRPKNTQETKPPTEPEPTPVVVNGLSGSAVQELLGQPATRAGPAPGETWTYRSGSCEVELFLFPDVTHGGLHVLDYRISGAGTREDEQQACLRRLRNDQSS